MMRDRTTSVKAPALHEGLDNVLFDVWLVSRATTAMLDKALVGADIDSDEFAIYSVLRSKDGMTPSELAHWMAAPPTTVSSYIKRFEARGHVRRSPNPHDGRSYRIHLTEAGARVHAAAGRLFLPVLASVNERLGSSASTTHTRLRALHETVLSVG